MRRALAALLMVLALAAAFAWYELYFRWRDCFNEQGRCLDEASGVVYHAQTGMPLALLALGLFIVAGVVAMHRRT